MCIKRAAAAGIVPWRKQALAARSAKFMALHMEFKMAWQAVGRNLYISNRTHNALPWKGLMQKSSWLEAAHCRLPYTRLNEAKSHWEIVSWYSEAVQSDYL